MSRLTEEMVIARAKQSDLGLIKKLNCWGSDLTDVNIIKRMHGVEVLALSVNKISTLAPFEDCTKLQELYLRKNNIQNINEIGYLQNLPALKYLWLEENPCCERAGPNYRSIVLRALPNLKKLDNVEVTPEELEAAIRNTGPQQADDDVYEDAYEPKQQQHPHPQQQPQLQRSSPQQIQQQQQQQQHQQGYPQQSPRQQQSSPQQQPPQLSHRGSSSPLKEPPQLASPLANNSDGTNNGANNVSDLYSNQLQNSMPPTPTKEPAHPPSPKYNTITKEQRTSFHQYDHSPGSDQESPHVGYRETRPAPLPPSMSTHSMKEYYQSDRPSYPAHYRHSQTDLTEWEEHQQPPQVHHNPYGSQVQLHYPQRRSAGPETAGERYAYRNGSARENGGEWEVDDRSRPRRPEGRYSDTVSTVSASVLNHFGGCHRRPVNRNSNLLSATLCLVKELDYGSLEVLEHAVRCRIDELAGE
ncbi:cilia- and flagella-associated protein 410 isoform X2 [Drosophila mojavensis]|uniref:Uncharacterized protein, isoform A n=1 Tax=Drosophila mojavensis TaxID=7230 RepID=B4KWK2_DROMO|nr:cilia- and flagella-associated protein 410 isoform X2 [Drosophila mojavensis]EDW19631.1 uncharacterized protein Dmoj_GI11416, isoform A [Drosophila mojavensis]KRG06708.1 uncharacterized protein Dmoj_GI11416, isoform B [Drosophila mojavensis]KRG06709.1 uncharacterized protein Dmoj_GI11416, isoform C [Drosophila mojavensis]KRG06712.1 uncharacterized protein Dmoj_GI11416, isoform F [Drosophila mojavensis]KRG06713.1 uncharacterized protein Dmoj_GI11416, isoform G [Drosophila mojavensis]